MLNFYRCGARSRLTLVLYFATQGMRKYFKRHAWGNTVLEDLLDAIQEVCAPRVRPTAPNIRVPLAQPC